MKRLSGKSSLQADNRENAFVADVREFLAAERFGEDGITFYTNKTFELLDDYAVNLGAGTEFSYTLRKRAGISGEQDHY